MLRFAVESIVCLLDDVLLLLMLDEADRGQLLVTLQLALVVVLIVVIVEIGLAFFAVGLDLCIHLQELSVDVRDATQNILRNALHNFFLDDVLFGRLARGRSRLFLDGAHLVLLLER